jgi:rod shape-determining protein MreC
VTPFVNFGSLDIVAVVVGAPPAVKHDSLLPKSPTPAPTVTVTVTATPGGPSTSTSTGPTGSTSPGSTPSNSSSP